MASDVIVDYAYYGQHITLTCTLHPNLLWSTKNIAPIGCRSIFFDLRNECHGPECDCSIYELRPHTEDEAIARLMTTGHY